MDREINEKIDPEWTFIYSFQMSNVYLCLF